MPGWFVFVDTQYYPYVANPGDSFDGYQPIEADTEEEAVNKSDADVGEDCYVVPWDSVKHVVA
jgi:hypothetical protein